MDITCVEEIPHVYTLGWYETTRNHTRYYDKPNLLQKLKFLFCRTNNEKIFDIFHGKAAELEFQRQANKHGYASIKGTSLFTGKPDDGIDHKYDKLGNVQIKYRHSQTFCINLKDIDKCIEKKCRLFVVRCDDFCKDYNDHKMTSHDQRLPPIPPLIPYNWYVYEINVLKAQADKKTEFNFNDRKYVGYGPW